MKKKIFTIVYLLSVLLLLGSLGFMLFESGRIRDTKKELSAASENIARLEIRTDESTQNAENVKKEKNAQKEDVQKETEITVDTSIEEDKPQTQDESVRGLEQEMSTKLAALQEDGSQWSVCFRNLRTGGSFAVNRNKMQAASLIKLYIMGCVYENYETMILKDTKEQVDEWLTQMITVSDNDAANTLVYMLGGGDEAKGREFVNQYALDKGYKDTHMGRMLLAPNDEDDNYTSVEDCGRFLQDCYENKLTSSQEMLEMLKNQTRRQKIPAGIPEGIVVGNKTGELQDVQNDAAIVFVDGNPYILCVMSQNLVNGDEAISSTAKLSGDVYSYVTEKAAK